MQTTLGPPLHSLYIFLVVSADRTPLVPMKLEDWHMRKPCWSRYFCTWVVWTFLVCPGTLAILSVQAVLTAAICLMGWLMDRLFWLTNEGPRLFSFVVSFRMVFRKVARVGVWYSHDSHHNSLSTWEPQVWLRLNQVAFLPPNQEVGRDIILLCWLQSSTYYFPHVLFILCFFSPLCPLLGWFFNDSISTIGLLAVALKFFFFWWLLSMVFNMHLINLPSNNFIILYHFMYSESNWQQFTSISSLLSFVLFYI